MKTILETFNEYRKELMGKYYKPMKDGQVDEVGRDNMLFIFDDNNDVCALAIINVVRSLTRKVLTIEDIIVSKEYRGKGIGRELMELIMIVAKKKKVDCIEVQTKKTNKVAREFYKKFKFKDRGQVSLRLWLK